MHLVRGRRVMDQFHHLGAQHDRTFRCRDILAQLEGFLVDLADHALVVDEVVIGVLQAFDQAEAATGDRHLLRAGIADQRIGGRKAVDNDRRYETRAVFLQFVQFEIVQPAGHALLNGEVILHPGAHEGIVLPRRIHESFVLGIGGEIGFACHDLDHVAAHDLRMLHQPLGIGSRLAQQDRHRAEDILARQADQGAQGAGVLSGFVFQSRHDFRILLMIYRIETPNRIEPFRATPRRNSVARWQRSCWRHR